MMLGLSSQLSEYKKYMWKEKKVFYKMHIGFFVVLNGMWLPVSDLNHPIKFSKVVNNKVNK